MLEGLGCRVDVVGDGRDAVDALLRKAYDLVFMDRHMPRMDGLEATAAIRKAEGESKRTVIVAMTASALQGEKEECLAAGMDDFISKPVLLEDLIRVIDRWSRRNGSGLGETTARASAPEPESLDNARLEQLKRLSRKHDPGMLKNLISDFLEGTPVRIAKMREAVNATDAGGLGTLAHGLLGVSGNLGLRRMAMLCGKLQYMSHADSLTGANETIEDLGGELVHVRSLLEPMSLVQED
jgi:CheY-like chemotaxis protein/HPt (histidine-containing phosphotransfer) domain-containing protein